MTLGQGKRRVLMLMDEYSTNGTPQSDADIKAKMAPFFDAAQKDVAKVRKIVKSYELQIPVMASGTAQPVDMPADFAEIVAVRSSGRPYYPDWRTQTSAYFEAGSYEIAYAATPPTIPDDAPEEYKFAVDEESAECMPWYVCAMQLINDPIADYTAAMNRYYQMLASLGTTVKNGRGRIRNVFSQTEKM